MRLLICAFLRPQAKFESFEALVQAITTDVEFGQAALDSAELAALQGPVLGHFAQSDPFIDAAMVSDFVAAMSEAGRALTVYWYEADHAFANPAGSAYDAEAAALAWERTTSFLAQALQPDG